MILVEGLRKSHRDGDEEVPVLVDVSFAVEAGEMVALRGPSGAGKSTLLHILGGLDTGYAGRVEVGGRRLAGMGEGELGSFRNREVGFVFQAFNLVPPLTVLQNVLLPTHFSRAQEPRAKELALAALEEVGLAGKAHRLPSCLSGGERQRVAIARAVFRGPRILLADEPTGSLDARAAEGVIDLLRRLHEGGTTVIVASHESSVWEAAERRLTLREGAVREERG